MATLDPSNGIDRLLLFYQYYTGELYHNVLSNQGTWQGPQSFGVQDAMNGTPITTASYVIGDTALVSSKLRQIRLMYYKTLTLTH